MRAVMADQADEEEEEKDAMRKKIMKRYRLQVHC